MHSRHNGGQILDHLNANILILTVFVSFLPTKKKHFKIQKRKNRGTLCAIEMHFTWFILSVRAQVPICICVCGWMWRTVSLWQHNDLKMKILTWIIGEEEGAIAKTGNRNKAMTIKYFIYKYMFFFLLKYKCISICFVWAASNILINFKFVFFYFE